MLLVAEACVEGGLGRGGSGAPIAHLRIVRLLLRPVRPARSKSAPSANRGAHLCFRAVPPSLWLAGVYLLEASHPQHVFPTTKIRISADGSVKALSYAFPGAERQIVAYPLRLSPVAQPNYFVQKPQPSLISMLSNPQVLIMGFMLVATFFMQSNSSSQSEPRPAPLPGCLPQVCSPAASCRSDPLPSPPHPCLAVPTIAGKEQKEEMRQQMKEMGFAGNPGDLQGMMSKLMGGGAAAADSDDEG